jgi:two-component system, NtrC family, sensor kinase
VPRPKWYRSLGFKIIVSVGLTAVAVNASFGYLYLTVQERQMGRMILRSAVRNSETIQKSIRFDMLENRKQHAYGIMETIGAQEGIEKVRIFGGEGNIIFSTDKREVGHTADKKAEACYACHAENRPLVRLTTHERSRTFHAADGHTVMGIINPLYNEPACARDGCHVSTDKQQILGVIDVTMSLRDVERDLSAARRQVFLFNLLSIVLIAVLMVLLIMRLVIRPVEHLVIGTNKVAGGDLEYSIPVRGDDEMGDLARSFNNMTARLSKSDEELRDAQQHLLRAEKLAAVGRMAATVAHEINNPLAGVYTYTRLIIRRLSEGKTSEADIKKLIDQLGVMAREVERATNIVLNLLDFTRPKEPAKTPTQLNTVIEESLQVLTAALTLHDVRITKTLGAVPEVKADPAQIKQVFLNILTNACEAMQQGGALSIVSRPGEAPGSVAVEFTDTGAGIPPDVLPKIFDPFVSTKNKGTGLGLAVAYDLVSRHGGKLEVSSALGEGTCMTVVLPGD